jgi:YbbR domain-containing protein
MTRGWLRRALLRNLALKLISLALALLLFVVVHSERQSLVQGALSVSYVPPSVKLLAQQPPATLRVGVTGPQSRIQRFRLEDLGPITIDLTAAREGYFRFKEDALALPIGLRVAFIRPDGFQVRFAELRTREVPVRLEVQGQPAAGYRVVGRRARPAQVTVTGARYTLDSPLFKLRTDPIGIDGADGSRAEQLRVAIPAGVLKIEPPSVEGSVEIAPIVSDATLRGVHVQLLGADRRRAVLSATTVTVRVEAATVLLTTLAPAKLVALVHLKDARRAVVKPAIIGLPPGVRVLKVTPPTIEVSVPPEGKGHRAAGG